MRTSKKIFLSLLLLFISIVFIGCNNNNQGETEYTYMDLNIYSINDFHGAIFEEGSGKGIFKIGEYLINEKKNNPDSTVIISAGDMFQGTAVSSMTRGRAVLDAMNIIGFDAMTIGNHEFDWGIETILKYQDGNLENGEANFPLLVSNIMDKSTNELVSWAKPYTTIVKGKYKIGIVGVIGHDQTSDILTSYVENYEFTNELEAIKKYTKILRTEEDCDLVIISCHCDTSDIAVQLSQLTDEYYIDAIINGHTHQAYYGEYSFGDRFAPLPYVQSGSSGSYIGKITLRIYDNTKQVILADSENITLKNVEENQDIIDAINKYQDEITASNEQLGLSGEYVTREIGGQWASNVVKEKGNCQIGIVNKGGIRAAGFPINNNQMITYGDIFQIMPFENEIRTVDILGSEVRRLYDYEGLYFSDNVTRNNGIIYVDSTPLDDNEYYSVSTIDFLYEKNNYPFKYGKNGFDTNILFRDALVEAVKESVQRNGKFMPFA